jgi:hypothetical protein
MAIGTSDGQTYNTRWEQVHDSFQDRFQGMKPSEDPNVLEYDPKNVERPEGRGSPAGLPDPTSRQYRGQKVKIAENFEPVISDSAKQYDVNPHTLTKLLHAESSFDPKTGKYNPADSSTGAQGPAQFMPATAKQYGVNVKDTKSSIEGAAHYLGDMQKKFGSESLGLAAYNWGETKLKKWIDSGSSPDKMPLETRNYVAKITGEPPIYMDRGHDVPLAASSIMGHDRSFQGIAVDRHAPDVDMGIPGWSPFHGVAVHEQAEIGHMNNLIDAGMKPEEAYQEAHDKIATPMETAHVKAVAKKAGKDPEAFHEAYKQYWREVYARSRAKSNPNVHPRAHTTVYKLDKIKGQNL